MRAPAKLNLCLFVGARRDDGLHELRSLFCPLELSDRILVTELEEGEDAVICEGVSGPNLAAEALAELRARGWKGPPMRIEIDKRIPVAAGLGGGSADAAAVLRMARGEVSGLAQAAMDIGADVPSQIDPAFALVSGAGEVVEELPPPKAFGVVLVPFERGLSAGEVYAKADEMGIGRSPEQLETVEERIRGMASSGASPLDYTDLLFNDLEAAAVALHDEIGPALEALREVGAARAMVSGSGPTAFGIFDDVVAADRAAASLPPRWANAIVTGAASAS